MVNYFNSNGRRQLAACHLGEEPTRLGTQSSNGVVLCSHSQWEDDVELTFKLAGLSRSQVQAGRELSSRWQESHRVLQAEQIGSNLTAINQPEHEWNIFQPCF